ncbi:ABATE domain-containing protein [Chelativorans sp. J32]|uniref:CGNR zinc finger domain-containing protein n=1 Tax=Chelativorans sp. J32 TaxID=935840 RepID=UPI00048A1707|nr:ABATE domain-containing protein [Chelativorans sp. J32]
MSSPRLEAGPVPFFLGGRLCLDFVNTVNSRSRPATRNYLPGFDEVIGWGRQTGLFGPGAIDRLEERARAFPSQAAEAHGAIIAFREALYRIFRSVIDETPAPEADMRRLSDWLREARNQQVLSGTGRLFSWAWDESRLDFRSPACAVAVSAEHLLTHEDLKRVKECPGPEGCGWLFYDETKNVSRRWCSMEHCGGAAKARRYAERHRH